MKNRKIITLVLSVILVFTMMPTMAFAEAKALNADDVVILATSDVHCAVDDKIGYAGLAGYRDEMRAEYAHVALVDAGDAIQGGPIGTLSKGEYIMDIMNEVGFDVVVPGNHEFDYGMDQFLNVIAKKSKTPYISAIFIDLKTDKLVFEPYVLKTYGTKKIAFVGITTPETKTKSSPVYFQDGKGNWIYDFANDTTGKALYSRVQTAIDSAKKAGADTVIAVGHLGDDPDTEYWKSSDVVANTTGIDGFIDGHAHMTFVKTIKNKAGKNVTVLSTGSRLENIGKMTVKKDGSITAENITGYANKNEDVDKYVKGIQAKLDGVLKKVVAKTAVELTINRADGTRAIRSEETNLGDLCADAYKAVSGADIAIVNGGGIRTSIAKGDITYEDIIKVHPFGNELCVVEATGQEILDALELGSRSAGEGESGGFLQVAGMSYTINPFIKSAVVLDENKMFVKIDGSRRVSEVKVNGKAIDPNKTYTVASHNYLLKQMGDGYTMFADNKFTQYGVMLDNQVLITYITDKLNGVVGNEYAAAQGRIKVLTHDEVIAPTLAALESANSKLAVAEYIPALKVKNSKKSVTLNWKAATASGVKYEVWRSVKKSSGYKKVLTTSKNTYKTTKLTKGKKYYFKIRAIKTIDGAKYLGHWSNRVVGRAA